MSVLDDIDNIKRITLNDGDALFVRVKRNDLPAHLWVKYTENIRNSLQLYFLSNRIIVAGDDIDITVIEQNLKGETNEKDY